jgi:hypothetical protein
VIPAISVAAPAEFGPREPVLKTLEVGSTDLTRPPGWGDSLMTKKFR